MSKEDAKEMIYQIIVKKSKYHYEQMVELQKTTT